MHDALNVGLVITLTKEEPLPDEWFSEVEGVDNYFSPIPDGMAPTMQQMDEIGGAIVRAVSSGRAVLEHCGGGKGRAGTIASCLLLRFGPDSIRSRIENGCLRPQQPVMSAKEAIAEVRRRRPGSIETVIQESFVRAYAQHLWRTAAIAEQQFAENCLLENELQSASDVSARLGITTKRRVPKYIVLAGLPGSGTFLIGLHSFPC